MLAKATLQSNKTVKIKTSKALSEPDCQHSQYNRSPSAIHCKRLIPVLKI